MSDVQFDYQDTTYRWVQVKYGETLQQIAARELLDAGRWYEIISINGLRYPYLAATASDGVIAYGGMLMVPSSATVASSSVDPNLVFERDIKLTNGLLSGDLDIHTADGVGNLSQALRHRVMVDTKEMLYHPAYGCRVREVLGAGAGLNSALLAGAYVRAALLKDPRVSAVKSVDVQVFGDQIAVRAEVLPIDGRPLQINVGM